MCGSPFINESVYNYTMKFNKSVMLDILARLRSKYADKLLKGEITPREAGVILQINRDIQLELHKYAE
jgi:hypothetical protein